MIYGIDLGTTKSVIGFWKGHTPFIIPMENGSFSIPSTVLYDRADGNIYAGEKAKKHKSRYNTNGLTINSIKRSIGTDSEIEWVGLKSYPQEITAFILAELKYQAEQYTVQNVEDVVIAIPSNYTEQQ